MTNMCVADFNRRFYGESDAVYDIEDYNIQHVGHLNQEKLESLKNIRENINWEIGEERDRFIWKVFDLLSDCDGPIPDLRDILEQEEIDWILAESAMNRHGEYEHATNQFLNYVVSSSCNKLEQPNVDRVCRPPLPCLAPKPDTTGCDFFKVNKDRRLDVNRTDAFGLPHFHAACMSGLVDVVETFLELGQDPNCLAQKTDATPLSLALSYGHRDVIELLLRRGADPNHTDEDGSSYLHMICEKKYDIDLAMMLFVISSDVNRPVKVNARDKKGRTPLYVALSRGYNDLAALLLISGAESNLADVEGSTPLHVICKGDRDDGELVKMFFELSEDSQQRVVQVNALDKFGRTPLHLALYSGHTNVIKFLLKYGVRLDLADAEGTTPLHIVCRKKYDDDLVKTFFETAEAEGQSGLFDVRDKKGRTPLKWAVASFRPSIVDRLLDSGADLSRFVFPTKRHFIECVEANEDTSSGAFRLTLTADAMGVVERLEKRGYELDQNDAMSIMKLFSKYGVFKKSVDNADERWHVDVDDEEFATKAKKITVKADLSLYELLRLRLGEATKRFTHEDCLEFVESNRMWLLHARHVRACARHLCELMARKFYLSWALEFFCKLTHYRLLAECCEMVLEKLSNDDLWRICLADSPSII